MYESITELQALHLYPELRALLAVRRAGWVFRELHEGDEIVGIVGSLSRRQYTDAIFIFDRHDVAAARVLDDSLGGGCVWSRERADLAEIVTELLDLPEPGQSGAPALVKRSNPWRLR